MMTSASVRLGSSLMHVNLALLTVCASIFRQATFETPEAPGYHQLSQNASAPSLQYSPPPLRGLAESQGTSHRSSSVACHGDKHTQNIFGHQHDHGMANNMATVSGDIQVDQPKEGEAQFHHQNGLSFPGGDNDETARAETAPWQANKSSCGTSPPTIFLWKGHNYLVKMAHDLNFLDDENEAAPVPAWLGFSVQCNPFLIPPEGHNICDILQRGHEERRKEIAVRRRRRQQQHHRFGGTGNGPRRFSRSRSRSRANSGTNRQRESGDGDGSAFRSCGQVGQGQQNEPGGGPGNTAEGGVAPLQATGTAPHQQYQCVQRDTDSTATENDDPQARIRPVIALPGGVEGGKTFVTEGRMLVAEGSLGSASTSAEPPLLWGVGEIEDEDIPCELSSGEEEEVEWNGGGYLSVPIIPDLPEAIRSKASAAAETLRSEGAAEKELESNALAILANAKRTQEMRNQPDEEHSSRVEWLAERSSRNGLRGALVDRHVGATRLRSMAYGSCWRDKSLVRRVSTAPAVGVRAPQRKRGSCAGWAFARSANSGQEDPDQASAAFGTSRGGVCVSVDGGVENGHNERTQSNHESRTRARSRRLGSGSRNPTSLCGGASPSSRLHRPDRVSVGVSEGSTGSASATSLAERSMAVSSLQASSSSMSARARARATASRPTATRRPFGGNAGRLIIIDPGKVPEVRHKAAMLIQAGLLGVSARIYVRRLRDNRERAALLIGQNWRRSRARLRMWNAKRLRRAEELRQVAEGRTRDRAAHLLQTFFRDIKYRRKRVRYPTYSEHFRRFKTDSEPVAVDDIELAGFRRIRL